MAMRSSRKNPAMVSGREVFPAAARRRTQALMRGPARNSRVAASSSQGIKCRKMDCGVPSKMRAPITPPMTPVTSRDGGHAAEKKRGKGDETAAARDCVEQSRDERGEEEEDRMRKVHAKE